MPKHIDVDELKEWVGNWFEKNRYYHPYSKSNDIPIPELYDILEQMPTADVVEVVRCKECKYFDQAEKYCCDLLTAEEDGFCKWGERRDDD